MNAVYCSLPVVADDVTGSKEIDVFSLHVASKTEKGIQCLILAFYLLGNPGVKRRVGKERGPPRKGQAYRDACCG